MEANQKKELMKARLDNLYDDLVVIQTSLNKETKNVEEKLDEMKIKLLTQKEILNKNAQIRNEENIHNKRMISELFNDIQEQVNGMKNEKESLDDYFSKISSHNANIS